MRLYLAELAGEVQRGRSKLGKGKEGEIQGKGKEGERGERKERVEGGGRNGEGRDNI